MKTKLSLSLVALTLAGSISPALAAEPFEVLRAGDRALACEAIAAEVNDLNRAVSERQKAEQAKARRAESGRKMLGFAAGAMSGALPMLASRADSPMGAYAAQAAISAVQQGQMTAQMNQMNDMMDGGGEAMAPAEATPEQARITHLTGLFNEKGC